MKEKYVYLIHLTYYNKYAVEDEPDEITETIVHLAESYEAAMSDLGHVYSEDDIIKVDMEVIGNGEIIVIRKEWEDDLRLLNEWY